MRDNQGRKYENNARSVAVNADAAKATQRASKQKSGRRYTYAERKAYQAAQKLKLDARIARVNAQAKAAEAFRQEQERKAQLVLFKKCRQDRRVLAPVARRARALRLWLRRKTPSASKVCKVLKNRKLRVGKKLKDAKLIRKWLRNYRLYPLLTRKKGPIPFLDKKTNRHFYVSLISAIGYRFDYQPHYKAFRFSTRKGFTHSSTAWKPRALTLRGLWNFFENYRKQQGRALTLLWRKEQLARLALWVRSSFRLRGISKFYVIDSIQRVMQRIATWTHPEERRARLAQLQLSRWMLTKKLRPDTNYRWLRKTLKTIRLRTSGAFMNNWPKRDAVTNWQQLKNDLRKTNVCGLAERQHAPFKSNMRGVRQILWRFLSPEFGTKVRVLPPVTKKGLKPTEKQLATHLQLNNWTDFTKWSLSRYSLRQYAQKRPHLKQADKETKTKKTKSVWFDYREKTPRWRGRRRRTKYRRIARKPQRKRAAVKKVISQIYRTRALSIRPQLFTPIKLNFGLQKRFYSMTTLDNRHPKQAMENKRNTQRGGKNSRLRNASTEKHPQQQHWKGSNTRKELNIKGSEDKRQHKRTSFQKKTNTKRGDARIPKRADLIKNRFRRLRANKKSEVYRRAYRPYVKTRLSKRKRALYRVIIRKVSLRRKLRKRGLSFIVYRKKSSTNRLKRKVRKLVRAPSKFNSKGGALRKIRIAKVIGIFVRSRKELKKQQRQRKLILMARRYAAQRRRRLACLQSRQHVVAVKNLLAKRAGLTAYKNKRRVHLRPTRRKFFLRFVRMLKFRKKLRKLRAKKVKPNIKKKLKAVKIRVRRVSSNLAKSVGLIARPLISGLRKLRRKVRRLAKRRLRIKRRRVTKRARLSSRTRFSPAPMFAPTVTVGQYSYKAKNKLTGKKRIKRLHRLKFALQWNSNFKKSNKKLVQKFRVLRLQSTGSGRTRKLRVRTARGLLHSAFTAVPAFETSETWPFNPVVKEAVVSAVNRQLLKHEPRGAHALSRLLRRKELLNARKKAATSQNNAQQLSAFIRGVSRLSVFNKRKKRIADALRLAVKTEYSTSVFTDLDRRSVFLKRRNRKLKGLVRRVKWATRKAWGQKKAFKRALKKKVYPRGRYRFRGFKRKPSVRRRQWLRRLGSRTAYKHRYGRSVRLFLRSRVRRRGHKLPLRTSKGLKKGQFRTVTQLKKRFPFSRRFMRNASFLINTAKRTVPMVDVSKTYVQAWQQLKRAETRALLTRLPYYVAQYRRRSRLANKGGYRAMSRPQFTAMKNRNTDRHIAVLELHKERARRAARELKRQPFFNAPGIVAHEERFRRDIHRTWWAPANDQRTVASAGYPAVLGVRRFRRVFVAKFNKNRWWNPLPLSLPHYHPLALQAQVEKESVSAQRVHAFRGGRVKLINGKALAARENRKTLTAKKGVDSLQDVLSGKKRKNTFFGNFFRRSLFFTNENIWKNNTNWSLLEQAIVNERTGQKTLSGRGTYKKGSAFVDLVNKNSLVWKSYAQKQSLGAAAALQRNFISGMRLWLQERPVEKMTSTWSAATWLRFKRFVEGRASTTESAASFRRRFIKSSRKALFARQPNWWKVEAESRATLLFNEISCGKAPAEIISSFKNKLVARELFDVQGGFGWQEKKVLVFAAAVTFSGSGSALSKVSSTVGTQFTKMGDKQFTSMYNRWLSSVETHLKKNRTALSSQDYSNLRGDFVTDLEIEKPRFPGAGRRKKSYDALLRRHYAKTMPLKYRRFARRTFGKLRSSLSTSFISRAPSITPSAAHRRGYKNAKSLLFLPYPTKRSRELANRSLRQRKVSALTISNKTRLGSLPLRVVQAVKRSRSLSQRPKLVTRFNGVSEALLQLALRRRFFARRIRDLRKSSARRKIFSARIRPFWAQRKFDRKVDRAARLSRYHLAHAGSRSGSKAPSWHFSEFALWAPKKMARAVKAITPSGEMLASHRLLKRKLRISVRRQKVDKRELFKPRKATYVLRPKRKLSRGHKYKFRKLRFRGYRPRIKQISAAIQEKLLRRFEIAQKSLQLKLIKQARPAMVLSPLHFRRPTTRVSATAEEKERWRLFIQATRLRKYRRLTEISESLTTLFPQLISRILENKLLKSKVTQKVAAGWISGIYWSLRMYLNSNNDRKKQKARDNKLKQLQFLKKEITSNAEARFFDLGNLRAARYRFQPHRLHRAGSVKRGALEWLRQFLPKFYELYLEDPEKYKHLTLTPIKVYRSHLSRHAITERETRNVPGTMEQKYRRLTTARYGKNSTRFENMLMTTRRTPVLGGYGAAATLQVVSPVGSSTTRKSFFQRRFSTQARQQMQVSSPEIATAVLSSLPSFRRRTTTEMQALPHSTAVIVAQKLKARAVAKARAHNVLSSDESGVGTLDLRSIRAKSPRSAEYIERLTTTENKDSISNLLVRQELITSRVQKPSNVTGIVAFRDNRLTRAASTTNSCEELLSLPTGQSNVLRKYRTEVFARRMNTLLAARKSFVPAPKQLLTRRLFTKKKRAMKRNKAAVLTAAACGIDTKKIKSFRSILHFRNASMRASKHVYRTLPVIVSRAIQIRRLLWNSLRRSNHSAILVNKYKKQASKKTGLTLPSATARKLASTPESVKLTRKIHAAARKVVTGWEVGAIKRLFFAPARKGLASFWASKRATANWTANSRKVTSNFIKHAKAIHTNLAMLSKYANRIEKKQSRILSGERRPELWDMLTKRWNKKFRYLKKWLRDIKYAFKQHYWSYAGSHILPDELFKLARIRLRKLEWRESDELFRNDGLKHAFTISPQERKNTRWLEPLLMKRSLYNFRRGEYRRYQLPKDQKNRKWLQKLRKLVFRDRPSRLYFKRRKWPLLRMYNQRLYRSLFHLRNIKVAQKRFRKLARRKPTTTGLEKAMLGFGDRLDVNLVILGIAPTTFWAREFAPFGLVRVNGKVIRDAAFRFQPGDVLEWMWDKIKRARFYFRSPFKRFSRTKLLQETSMVFPGNFSYDSRTRVARYNRLPCAGDLPESGRLNEQMFQLFRLDSGSGHQ